MTKHRSLEGKVALVTGGSSGIGRATAKLLADNGAKVAVMARTAEDLEEVVEEICGKGGTAISEAADVSNAEEVEHAIQSIVGDLSRLDIVVANAGINGVWAPIDELEPVEFRRTIDINLFGAFLTIKYSVPYLKENGGSIIVTSSINGTRKFSATGATAYSASKAGQVAMMKMLALELASHGIRVNAICPGAVETSIEQSTEVKDVESEKEPVIYPEGNIPLTRGEPLCPEDVAELVLFLASDSSRYISGTEIWIDGAESLLQG